MIDYLDTLLKSATQEVFSTMLNFKVDFESPTLNAINGHAHVAGTIGFTGKFNGMVYMYTNADFARQITSNLLGLSSHEIEGDEMVNDAIGELTNMLSGHIKSRLCDRGYPCVMSIPTVVRGQSFQFEPISCTDRCSVCFRCGADAVLLGVIIKKAA